MRKRRAEEGNDISTASCQRLINNKFRSSSAVMAAGNYYLSFSQMRGKWKPDFVIVSKPFVLVKFILWLKSLEGMKTNSSCLHCSLKTIYSSNNSWSLIPPTNLYATGSKFIRLSGLCACYHTPLSNKRSLAV